MPKIEEPGPGWYTAHLTAFGSDGKNIQIGGKHKDNPNTNPAPGQYNPDYKVTRTRVKGAFIREETIVEVPRYNY